MRVPALFRRGKHRARPGLPAPSVASLAASVPPAAEADQPEPEVIIPEQADPPTEAITTPLARVGFAFAELVHPETGVRKLFLVRHGG